MNKWIWIIIAALALQGCKLGVDEEDDGEVETVTVSSTDDNQVIIDEEEQYSLSVTGSGNTIYLRGDVSEISVKGDLTTLVVEDDTLIDFVEIATNQNTLRVSGGLETTISDLIVNGSNNVVTVYAVTKSTVVDDSNSVNTVVEP